MTGERVAVQVGGSTVRVAVAPLRAGAPTLLAEQEGRVLQRPDQLHGLLAGLLDAPLAELLVVHPAGWPAERVAAWPGMSVPAPVAAAGLAARLVLDVGGAGAEAALVEGGRVLARRRRPVGGARMDAALAPLLGPDRTAARRVREALSLLPVADGIDAGQLYDVLAPLLDDLVALVRSLLAVRAAPVLLIGGVARSPLLAEALDAAGVADVVVAARPDAAAVLGALDLPRVGKQRPAPGTTRGRSGPGDAPAAPVPRATGPRPAPGPLGTWAPRGLLGTDPTTHRALPTIGPAAHRWLPPPGRRDRRPVRRVLGVVAALATAAGLVCLGQLLRAAPDASGAVPSGVLVQYGYRFDVPAGWEHSGGLPERRRSLLTPVATPEATDLIAVERTPLGYDAAAEPERARAELRATYDAAVATGSALSGYGAEQVAGRAVTAYRQADGEAVVAWFVLLDEDAQLSVGCRHTPAAERAVRAACEVVVGSLRRA
ncbi:type VII secretion-associated protein [Pseudonocardia sp.]|uniref:type VII secretion-associated protein n=1 Tax=Pseudonocardia sp. TaxID=60912 RepID=UPI0026341EFC|nr:type VII secretion-associated protein [Pseudonocardia sp.]MCW2719273.1 Type secretion-associated protein [Pseudonocardia sp.]